MFGMAASAAAQSPLPEVPARYDWTGLYGGVHAGYGWNDASSIVNGYPASGWTNASSVVGVPRALNAQGAIGGGQLGYSYQIDALIFGVEADLSAGSLAGKATAAGVTTPPATPFTVAERQHIEPFGTLGSRLGFTPLDRLMVFGTAGAAYGFVSPSTSLTFPRVNYTGGDSMAKSAPAPNTPSHRS